MKQIVHLFISLQIIGWVAFVAVLLVAPEEPMLSGETRGYIFLGIISMILCFIPAMRYSYRYDRQPIALFLAVLPLLVLLAVFAANTLTQTTALL